MFCCSGRLPSSSGRRRRHHAQRWRPADLRDPACESLHTSAQTGHHSCCTCCVSLARRLTLASLVFLQSFHLQPTGTPGTYYLQTTSSQGLPLSLSNNGTVTLATGSSPASHEHIILHSLSVSVCPFFLLFFFVGAAHAGSSPQTDGLCSSDGVIIQTVTSDSASSDALDQTQLVVEAEGRGQEEQLEATSVLEGDENIVTETQEPMTDGFSEKVGRCMCFYSEGLSAFPVVCG